MLTPDYLRDVPAQFVRNFQQLEDYIISELVKYIVISGELGATAQWEIWRAQQLGLSLDRIQAQVARLSGKTEAEVNAIFDDAAEQAIKNDGALTESARPGEIDDNPRMREYVKIMKQHTAGTLRNLTQSMGFAVKVNGQTVFQPIAFFYQEQLDLAHTQVISGVAGYSDAIRQAVNRLAGSGLRVVDYASGWHNRMDVAVRRAVLSGLKDLSRGLSRLYSEQMGYTIFEISAHSGARPSHQKWQGKRFDITGRDYPTEEQLTHGELNDYGCRHDIYPVPSKDTPYLYTREQLKKIDAPPFIYQGVRYTAYEATQQQRKIERKIRYCKEQLIGLQAAAAATQNQSLTEQLQKDFTVKAIRLQRLNQLYREFSAAAGLKEQPERKQFLGFGRALAAKATAAAKKG